MSRPGDAFHSPLCQKNHVHPWLSYSGGGKHQYSCDGDMNLCNDAFRMPWFRLSLG